MLLTSLYCVTCQPRKEPIDSPTTNIYLYRRYLKSPIPLVLLWCSRASPKIVLLNYTGVFLANGSTEGLVWSIHSHQENGKINTNSAGLLVGVCLWARNAATEWVYVCLRSTITRSESSKVVIRKPWQLPQLARLAVSVLWTNTGF